jgi:hypothetical protein
MRQLKSGLMERSANDRSKSNLSKAAGTALRVNAVALTGQDPYEFNAYDGCSGQPPSRERELHGVRSV